MEIASDYKGLIEFAESLKLMEEKFNEAVQQKKTYLTGCQHPLVYTAGLKSEPAHILEKIPVIKVRRGGSVTVHNPGQLMFYTVLAIDDSNGGLVGHIRKLEKAIIQTLANYGVRAFQHKKYTGVWTMHGKIAFIGLGLKKKCIYHGAAINITNNLNDYNPIKSCGLPEPITRLIDEIPVVENPTIPSPETFFHEMVKIWRHDR
ncbi:MAG: lipoyl(octanoyl) transferase LipB [Leptospirales bacterium]